MDNLKNIIKNKRVVLVGPSPSLLNKENGTLIDSYDIVIRIKKGFPIVDKLIKHLGKKTDILCSHLKLTQNNLDYSSLEQLYNSNCQLIYMPYPTTIEPFNRFYNNFIQYYQHFLVVNPNYNRKIPVLVSDKSSYLYHSKKMNTTPTTGIAMILDLLECDFKELFITGFTFRLDGYYEDYKTKEEDKESYIRTFITRKVHNTNLEAHYLKPLLVNKPNIILDEPLTNIFKQLI